MVTPDVGIFRLFPEKYVAALSFGSGQPFRRCCTEEPRPVGRCALRSLPRDTDSPGDCSVTANLDRLGKMGSSALSADPESASMSCIITLDLNHSIPHASRESNAEFHNVPPARSGIRFALVDQLQESRLQVIPSPVPHTPPHNPQNRKSLNNSSFPGILFSQDPFKFPLLLDDNVFEPRIDLDWSVWLTHRGCYSGKGNDASWCRLLGSGGRDAGSVVAWNEGNRGWLRVAGRLRSDRRSGGFKAGEKHRPVQTAAPE